MRTAHRLTLAGLLAGLALARLTAAADPTSWPTWRGAANTGAVAAAQPPLKWSDDQNIKWKAKIPGLGYSTPIIWKDRIYLLTAIETAEEGKSAAAAKSAPPPKAPPPPPPGGGDPKGRGGKKGGFGGGAAPTKFHEFVVLALDRGTGKTVWQKTARREVPHEGKHGTNSFASASPVTDGEFLYAPFGSRGFYCYDLQGNLKWEKDLGDMRTRGTFGEGISPALADGRLIISWDHQDGSFIVALDAKTGREAWRKTRDEISNWSTPVIVEVAGRKQAIVAGSRRTRSYDVATGDIVWEATGLTENVIPTPVVGHGLVYVMSGYRGNSIQAIKLTARGDVSETKDIVWNLQKSAPYVPSPVLSGDRLYVGKSNDAILSCINALTGAVYYEDQRVAGLRSMYASPLAANGHLYVVGREGVVVVLKDAPQFEVVATNKLSDPIDASPVILGRELFLRGHEHLYCITEG